MKARSRFVKSVVATAQPAPSDLPWTRGARRAQSIMLRRKPVSPTRRAA